MNTENEKKMTARIAEMSDWIKLAQTFPWVHDIYCPKRLNEGACHCGLDEFLGRPKLAISSRIAELESRFAAVRTALGAPAEVPDDNLADYIAQKLMDQAQRLAAVQADNADHAALMDLQHKRMTAALSLYPGEADKWPDLGEMLRWLMERAEKAEALCLVECGNVHKEKERADKAEADARLLDAVLASHQVRTHGVSIHGVFVGHSGLNNRWRVAVKGEDIWFDSPREALKRAVEGK